MAKQKQAQPAQKELRLQVHCAVARQIRQHCHTSTKAEVCGVLIGSEQDGITTIEAAIAGVNAVQGGTHVTFTQDTWAHIYQIKDKEYPDHRIVGWYHSHPGFGVFLSEHDTFIHQNFFSSPQQVAWVYDPHSEEEGCFAWNGTRLERLSQFSLLDEKGGEIAGHGGKAEPMLDGHEDSPEPSPQKPSSQSKTADPEPPWMRWVANTLAGIAILLLGFMAAWYFFPRPLFLVVDPRTGSFMVDPRTGQTMILSREELEALSKSLQQQHAIPAPPPSQKGKP